MDEQNFTIVSQDGTQLDATISTPSNSSKGVVVLVHGITGTKDEDGKYVRLATDLADAGLIAIRFSFRGHGESGGSQVGVSIGGEISDLCSVIRYANGIESPLMVVAFSFGAVSTLSLLTLFPRLFHRLVLWSPVLDLRATFLEPTLEWGRVNFGPDKLVSPFEGNVTVGERFELSIPLFVEMAQYDLRGKVAGLLIPTLVIHGSSDECVPFDISREACAVGNLANFLPIEHANHDFTSFSDEASLRRSTVAFLTQSLR